MAETLDLREDFQDLLLATMLANPAKFMYVAEAMKPKYFSGVLPTLCARAMLDHAKKYNRYPTMEVLRQRLEDATKQMPEAESSGVQDYVNKITDLDTSDWEYVRDRISMWLRERALINTIRKAVEMLKEDEIPPDGYSSMFLEAMQVGQNLDDLGYMLNGHDYRDVDKVIAEVTNVKFGLATGFPLLDGIWKHGWGPGWLVVPAAPPKRFKCFGKGTPILMFDGSTKKVEDVVLGDRVMGDDSLPRKVLTCGRGTGPLYKVDQAAGLSFVCNDAHILCVQSPGGDIREMEVEKYHKQAPWFKRQWKGYSVGIEFPPKTVTIDPYFLGLWLGDGTSINVDIAVGHGDREVAAFLNSYAQQLGMTTSCARQGTSKCDRVRIKNAPKDSAPCRSPGCEMPCYAGGFCKKHYSQARHKGFRVGKHASNKLQDYLDEYNLRSNKHIPELYRINSRERRLQVLAGLIDSDGTYSKKRGLIFTNSNFQLIEDTLWLAQSVGLRAHSLRVKTAIKSIGYTGTSWRVYIAGNISEIPTRIQRKMAANSPKRTLRKTLKVMPLGSGDYYGFTVDGNSRFLLGDFTVTHNSLFCGQLALNVASPAVREDVLYYACELSQTQAMVRAMCHLAKMPEDYLFDTCEKFTLDVKKNARERLLNNILFKSFPSKNATIGDLRAHAHAAVAQLGIKPRLIVIDYAETVQPSDKKAAEYRQQSSIYIEARAFAQEMGATVVMPDRVNRQAVDSIVPDARALQGAFEKAGIVDIAFGLCATDEEYHENTIRFFNFLNRHGPAFQHFRGKVYPELWTLDFTEVVPYEPDKSRGDDKNWKSKSSASRNAKLSPDAVAAMGQ